MSLQYGTEAVRKQDKSKEKASASQAVDKVLQEKANKSSPQGDNVIKLVERQPRDRGKTQPQRRRTDTMASSKHNTATETQQAPQTLITVEALQMLLTAATAQQQKPQGRRNALSNRRPREVVMMSFQCDREIADECDKVFAELQLRGEVSSKRETYERLFREGMKVVRQQAKQ